MSTIIKRGTRIAARVSLVLGIWVAIMIAMPFFGPAGRQMAVIGDPARAVKAVAAARGAVVEIRKGATFARSARPGFVVALYRNGAPLVIEGRIAAGCFRLAKAP